MLRAGLDIDDGRNDIKTAITRKSGAPARSSRGLESSEWQAHGGAHDPDDSNLSSQVWLCADSLRVARWLDLPCIKHHDSTDLCILQGLQSHASVSRAREAGEGVMQNIYDGLEEANSILERFYNRRADAGNGADLYASSSQLLSQLEDLHEKAEADRQALVLDVFSADRHNAQRHLAYPTAAQAIDIGLNDFESEMRGGRGPGRDIPSESSRFGRAPKVKSSAAWPVHTAVSPQSAPSDIHTSEKAEASID